MTPCGHMMRAAQALQGYLAQGNSKSEVRGTSRYAAKQYGIIVYI